MSRMENYQKETEKIISSFKPGKKPSLLLHACCGPCSSYVLEYLSSVFNITVFYYNPNIFPKEEYERRLKELKNFLPRFPAAFLHKVKLVECSYDPEEFYSALDIKDQPELAAEEEKGERCRRCYLLRMEKAWKYAENKGFDWFTTTLSISPFKDAEKINAIGKQLEAKTSGNGLRFLTSDFKKKGGFQRSLELSAEYGLYRQQYCGCAFSKKNTEEARKAAGQKKSGLSENEHPLNQSN